MISLVLVLGLVLIGVAVFFLVAAIFCWLWNITMPDVFELKKITFWQSFRLLLMATILLGGGGLGLSLGK